MSLGLTITPVSPGVCFVSSHPINIAIHQFDGHCCCCYFILWPAKYIATDNVYAYIMNDDWS